MLKVTYEEGELMEVNMFLKNILRDGEQFLYSLHILRLHYT